MKPDFSVATERCPVISRATTGSRERLMPHARVREYARGEAIIAAQEEEIDWMRAWLEARGQ